MLALDEDDLDGEPGRKRNNPAPVHVILPRLANSRAGRTRSSVTFLRRRIVGISDVIGTLYLDGSVSRTAR